MTHATPGLRSFEQTIGVDADRGASRSRLGEESLLVAARELAHTRWVVGRIGLSLARAHAWMRLDELATMVDLHQLATAAHRHPLADVRRRHRIQRLGHRYVMIALDPRLAPAPHLEGALGCRQ